MYADDVCTMFRDLEGRTVSVALADGSRLDAGQLVSAGRGGATALWIFHNGRDVFVEHAQVIDVWETAGGRAVA